MRKIAIYCRVSTDKQSKGLEAQEHSLRNLLKSKGIKSYVTFKDEGISGAKSSRPALNQLMEACRSKEICAVYVYSFSRFARSTKHLLSALELFKSLNIEFSSLSESVDTSTPMGRLVFTFVSALAEFERELISERVKNGLINARHKGKILGRPKHCNSELIRELASQGLSYKKIAKLAKCSPATVCRELKTFHK